MRTHALGKVLPGPVDILFQEGDYLQPDVVFAGTAQADLVSDRSIEGPPDLVVEVASPSTASRDRGKKLEPYRLFGAPALEWGAAKTAYTQSWRTLTRICLPR